MATPSAFRARVWPRQTRQEIVSFPDPFLVCARALNNYWVKEKRGKGSGESSRPSTGNGWNAGAVRMECIIRPASTSKRVVLEFSVAMAVTRSEHAIVQAIRSACDRVGVDSLKRKQIEAIVLHQDTFICACHAEDYCLQYCEYGYYSLLLFRCRQWLAQAMAVISLCDPSERRCAGAN